MRYIGLMRTACLKLLRSAEVLFSKSGVSCSTFNGIIRNSDLDITFNDFFASCFILQSYSTRITSDFRTSIQIVIRMQKNTVTAEDVFACLDDRDQLQPPEYTPSSGCCLLYTSRCV